MYLILNSKKLIVEICNHPSYVHRQQNGVIVLSDEEHADAIYSNDSDQFWPTTAWNYLCDVHSLVEVEQIPAEVTAGYYFYHAGEFYTTEEKRSALARDRMPDIANLMFIRMAGNGDFDDHILAKYPEQFPEWTFPVAYEKNTICQYKQKLYRCLQEHTSEKTWTPDVSPSLWVGISDPTEEWPAWVQPLGAVDSYEIGVKVSHGGKHWVSIVENNVWEPGVFGWEEQLDK